MACIQVLKVSVKSRLQHEKMIPRPQNTDSVRITRVCETVKIVRLIFILRNDPGRLVNSLVKTSPPPPLPPPLFSALIYGQL